MSDQPNYSETQYGDEVNDRASIVEHSATNVMYSLFFCAMMITMGLLVFFYFESSPLYKWGGLSVASMAGVVALKEIMKYYDVLKYFKVFKFWN